MTKFWQAILCVIVQYGVQSDNDNIDQVGRKLRSQRTRIMLNMVVTCHEVFLIMLKYGDYLKEHLSRYNMNHDVRPRVQLQAAHVSFCSGFFNATRAERFDIQCHPANSPFHATNLPGEASAHYLFI